MTPYKFQTSEFAISDNGIHLLRSRFNYRTIAFGEIKRIRIEKGREINNWWIVFIIGGTLIGFGVYFSIGIIKMFIGGDVTTRHARMILLLMIPFVGGYFVYNALQTGLVLKIDCANGDKEMFPLRGIIKDQKLESFKLFLKEKIGTRVQTAA